MSNKTSEPRPYVLMEANYRQMLDARPILAVLPWGATEAHNYHLPHGTDVFEATEVAIESARIAYSRGARLTVLPTIPFGNNAQQLDQVATIHLSTKAAAALLSDVATSLSRQGISRLVILNAHGGNEFKPLARDLQMQSAMLIVVINFWQMLPSEAKRIFDQPGDHAGELETSLMMHLTPTLVEMHNAGPGKTLPFNAQSLRQPGIWTPRPWSKTQPDTGAGDPAGSTADKGREYFGLITQAVADVLYELATAPADRLP